MPRKISDLPVESCAIPSPRISVGGADHNKLSCANPLIPPRTQEEAIKGRSSRERQGRCDLSSCIAKS